MSKKGIGQVFTVVMITGLVLCGCNKKSTKIKPPISSNWIIYNTSNSGITYNGALAIAPDSSKWWFGTNDGVHGGLSMFDGTNWTTYNTSNSGITNNDVRAIAIDASGDKWFGTKGVSKFHE